MKTRGIRAGLDVYAVEPTSSAGEFQDDIVKEEGLYGTHHIGASTDQAQEAIAAETVRIVKEFKGNRQSSKRGEPGAANSGHASLVVRHLDRPGVLAGVLDAIKAEHINVQEMENIVFEGAAAAVAHQPGQCADKETLNKLQANNADIIELDLLDLK